MKANDLIDAASFYSKYGSPPVLVASQGIGKQQLSYLLAKGMISYWRLVSLSAAVSRNFREVQTLD